MNAMEMLFRSGAPPATIHALVNGVEISRTQEVIRTNVGRLAAALRSLGVGPGARVLILPANTLDSLESILAVVSMGAVAVPVNPQLGLSTLSGIIDDVRPVCCIAEVLPAPELCARLKESCRDLILMRFGEGAEGMRRHRLSALRDRYADSELKLCEREDDDVALLLHTSGSTGRPKRIYRTHSQLAAFIKFDHVLYWQFGRGDGDSYVGSPLVTSQLISHLAALGYCMEALYAGGQVYLLQQFDAAVVLDLIEKAKVRFLLLIPSLYELLLYEIENQPHRDVSSLRCCVYGGEACPPEIARRIEKTMRVKPLGAYGLTECVVGFAHARALLEAEVVPPHSVGKHLFGEIRLVDEHGNESAQEGELWVRNPTIPKRTVNGETDPRVTVDGWFRTGDILSRDTDGNFYHRGRVDDMFLCNGNNVYPAQMEQILATHPEVAGVVVAPVSNPRGHTVAAALVRRSGSVTSTQLMEHARRLGPAFAVPAFMEFTEEFPVAPSGKLDRAAVRKHLQSAYEATRAGRVSAPSAAT